MKKQNKDLINLILIIGFIIITMTSCEKKNVDLVNLTKGKTTAAFNPNLKYGTMTDQDGNVYKTIKIGSQIWMAENLRTIHYRNGDPVINVTENAKWDTTTSGAYCSYNNIKNADSIATYGMLYNWYAVSDPRRLAPTGWHIPTDKEWGILINYLGGDSIAGGKLKERGTEHWESENVGATNESGFTALPSGARNYYDGSFNWINDNTFWWSSTEEDNTYAWYRYINRKSPSVERFSLYVGNKRSGFAIRCIKDY